MRKKFGEGYDAALPIFLVLVIMGLTPAFALEISSNIQNVIYIGSYIGSYMRNGETGNHKHK